MKDIKTILTAVIFTLSGLASMSTAQEFYDLNTVQTIEVWLSQSDWDSQMDNEMSTTEDYIMADSVAINGVTFDSVGVKYKGNSSYNADRVKNPWHIELDTYKDQEYQDYKDIKLANGFNDPSFLRDVLSYYIIRQYMEAPLANYANLYVNGTLIGLYSNTEAISKTFVKDRFGSKTNTFVKCSPPDGANPMGGDYPNLVYLGQDSSDYYDAYEVKSDAGWQELINLCDTLTNNTSALEEILDVDKTLWMLALDNTMVNLDSYIGMFSQNYYLYRDDYQRFLPVIWDLNESFGVFSQTGTTDLHDITDKQQMSHYLHSGDSDWPLVQKILSIPKYERMYLAHMKTILQENFENDSYYTIGQDIQDIISASVQADDNKFFTYNDFLDNLTTDISGGSGPPPQQMSTPGITNLMDGRSSYLLSLSDFTTTEPVISDISLSESDPSINDSIAITVLVSNANTVYLKYRSAVDGPFVEKEMFDDGLHNDGSAGDNVYAVGLSDLAPLTQYYFYAENNDIGKFSPQRAAHEYYTLNASSDIGDVVINELLASNDAVQADQNSEYDDWIELYNNTSSQVDLSGYYLSDDNVDYLEWQIPEGTVIGANDYLIIWADDDVAQDGLHASFKLSASGGEYLVLSNASGVVVDLVEFPPQTTDISYGRFPNGTGSFQTMPPSFNEENMLSSIPTEETTDGFSLNVFPNPTSSQLTIEADTKMSEVSLYNLSGKLLQTEYPKSNTARINLSDLAVGMYLIKVRSVSGNMKMKKLMRN